MKEGNKSSPVHDYLIPVRLVVLQQPFGANETVPFLVQPKLRMVDELNRTVSLLGHGQQGQWYVFLDITNNHHHRHHHRRRHHHHHQGASFANRNGAIHFDVL